ncbi:MAG: RES family NAD+ phosphorylase, partial [Campylobacterota bacterium]|nr:RES family NAD+ phosphorylase [Campylobacterota bacterium]
KEYFCEYCFESKNIKNFIKENGIKLKEIFNCGFCYYETEVCDYEVEECLSKYCNECMENIQKIVSEKEFEEKEDDYYDNCEKKCKEKYLQKCKDINTESIFVIKKEKLILKLKEIILKLYTYDWDNTYNDMLRYERDNDYLDNGEYSGTYANSPSINDLEGVEGKPEYKFSDLENVLNDIGIDDVNETFLDIFHQYIISSTESYRIEKDGGALIDWDIGQNVWKDNCLYTEELQFIDWNIFTYNVKHKARFFDHKNFSVRQNLKKFDDFFKLMEIKNSSIIYRARKIYNDKDKEDIEKEPEIELGKAPIKIVKNNRFSPVGISYGYFAFDKETALVESRAEKEDIFAIGEFQQSEDLKIIDFRKDSLSKFTNPFIDTFNMSVYCPSFTINQFIKDISKPINEKDTALEYVPTQIMAEYIWSLGYDGFIFDSSQNKGGENLVLFGENPKCINHKFVEIKQKNTKYIYEEV